MGATGIEWTKGPNGEPGFTFNPWIGCTKILGSTPELSACLHCYAETASAKFGSPWGPHADRRPISESTWLAPRAWDRRARRERRRFRVFCASMADVFDNHRSIQWEWRERLWKLIADTPNLDWLLLTKRPENALNGMLPISWMADWPRNVWFGFTAETQGRFDQRAKAVRQIPAPIRFMSGEPLLGDIELPEDARHWLKWVIAGGESGRLDEIRDTPDVRFIRLRSQCRFRGIPYYQKQLAQVSHRRDFKKFDQFPPVLQVREHPRVRIAA
jgi:protein gp37